MGTRTLKENLNDVLNQSGFLARTVFAASNNIDDRQMMAIANRVAIEIRDYWSWPELRLSETITLESAETLYDLPDDFRSMVPDSAWETNGSRPVEWPVPDGRWYMYKNAAFSDGGVLRVRQYGLQIEVLDPVEGAEFTFEYISDAMVRDTEDEPKTRFTADTDTFVMDDQLFVLGVQAHWAETKMMPQAQAWRANYMGKMHEAIGRASGGRTIGGNGSRNWTSRSPYTPTYIV